MHAASLATTRARGYAFLNHGPWTLGRPTLANSRSSQGPMDACTTLAGGYFVDACVDAYVSGRGLVRARNPVFSTGFA